MLEEKIYKDNQEPPKNVIWHKVSDAGQDLGYYKNTNNKWNKIDINEGELIRHIKYEWVSGASYGKEDIVFHKGSSYIALSDNPSTEPSFTYDHATGSYNVSAGWGLLAVGAAIVQETGDSQDKVMSQKAVTDALTASDQKLSELDEQINGKDSGSIKQPTTDDIYQQNLNSIGSWARGTSNVVLIDVRGARGYGIRITNYSNSTGGRCGFVTDANLDGSAPVYCEGTSFFNFNGSDLSVPNDANYLIFNLNTQKVLPIVELIGGEHTDGILDKLEKKQDTLISGTNIKTINGHDILGEGNIEIQGGGGTTTKTRNLLNPNDIVVGLLSASSGSVGSNELYNSSGFIEVTEGQIIVFSYSPSGIAVGMNVKVIAAYDENKVVIPSKGVSVNSLYYVVPSGVSYIRYSWNNSAYTTNLMAEVSPNYNPSEYIDFGNYEGEVVVPKHIFLPRYVYVAVGRTIEIYNDQICLEANKYHFQWICAKGTAFGRKFSVTGDSTSATTRSDASLQVGQHRLTLCIWDDNERCVWAGQTILVFKTATASGTILPIGDSLTNWKKWLPEVMHLSNNAISFIGTRYSGVDYDSENNEYPQGTIHHEGRSGWSAGDYRANATYDLDSRYDGVESVSGASNPFWDGNKFSLSHYLTTQGKSLPSAVQLFLGTNDLGISIEAAVQNIVGLVSDIREEYATIPIFVCNTIYRSKQDGYGSIGDDGYASSGGASTFEYNEDVKVNVLMQKICAALQNMANVYIIPLASTHDTLYNFGSKEIVANPRAIQKVSVPIESVHPQAQGYFQMADEMYSAYCAALVE